MKSKYINIQKDKHNVKCRVYTQDDNKIKKMVIYGHGFAGHKDNKAAERLANKLISKNQGYALISFDLPCHGDDVKKKITLDDCITYLDIVINESLNEFGAEKLYANAISFGGYLILKYIAEYGNPFEKIVLRNPSIKMFDVVSSSMVTEEVAEKLRKGKDAPIGFDRKVLINQQFLDDLEKSDLTKIDFIDYADSILIMHGTKDEIAPFNDSVEFCENNVIDFVPVENADHRYKDLTKLEFANALAIDFYSNE